MSEYVDGHVVAVESASASDLLMINVGTLSRKTSCQNDD